MIWCVEGDLFRKDINAAISLDLKQYGNNWGLWGKWVYGDGRLIALFSIGYGKTAKPKAYAVKEGYEETVNDLAF